MLSTEQNETFFADFKLEGPKFCRYCILTSKELGDLFSGKYQNYPALDNPSVYFSMIMNIKEQIGKIPKNQLF